MQFANGGGRQVDLIVVGGGLAGLCTAAIVAGAGRRVVVLERSQRPGGRAITRVEAGVHFNLGPHALYCRGAAFGLLQELGVRFTGRSPDARRSVLTDADRSYAIPRGLGSVLVSRMLTVREKARMIGLFATLPRMDARPFDGVPLGDWIRRVAGVGNLARMIRTFCRVGTYGDDPARMSAGAAIDQLKRILGGGVWYLDGGWQVLVDGLRARLTAMGVEVRTGCRVVAVRSGEDSVAVEVAAGETLEGRAAVLAVDPEGAARLLGGGASGAANAAGWPDRCLPVRAACLDVALDALPRPSRHAAFDLVRPLYFSVHSASARLAPEGMAVVHVMKYLGADPEAAPDAIGAELERFLDRLQPGWRAHERARQFLPGMTVAHALPRADEGGLAGRPGVLIDGMPNVFLAGDWVGERGLLADASAASAREAARRVLDAVSPTARPIGGGIFHASA